LKRAQSRTTQSKSRARLGKGHPRENTTGTELMHDLARAFCEPAERYALGEWNPAVPGECTVGVCHQRYSIRDICSLVLRANDNGPLPEKTLVRLLQNVPAQHDRLREKLAVRPWYLVRAQCLIDLMMTVKPCMRYGKRAADDIGGRHGKVSGPRMSEFPTLMSSLDTFAASPLLRQVA
jgi:hypothetical protein